MRRASLLVAVVVAGVVGMTSVAQSSPPRGISTFNVFGLAPVKSLDTFPSHFAGHVRKVDLPGGPVYVVPLGLQVCIVKGMSNGSGSGCASLDQAKNGMMVSMFCADAACIVQQLVPNGIPFVKINGRRIRVVSNVVSVPDVPREVAFAYAAVSGTYGLEKKTTKKH